MRFSVVCVLGAVVFGGCVQATDPPSEPAPEACPNAVTGCARQPHDAEIVVAPDVTTSGVDGLIIPDTPTGFADDACAIHVAGEPSHGRAKGR